LADNIYAQISPELVRNLDSDIAAAWIAIDREGSVFSFFLKKNNQ
jgi:hypothetical protein